MKISPLLLIFSGLVMAFACKSTPETTEGPIQLPILGERYVDENQDTIYHQIADFAFINQLGDTISSEDVEGKVYVADFFFTTCPTICPIMKKEMLRVYEKFGGNPEFMILSHSIDPSYDTQEVLRDYAEKLGVEDAQTWNFLTGDQEKIFEIGQTSYLTTAMADQAEPGGFLHSGAFLLVDQKGHIRGVYDGTKSDQVDRLLNDIPKLLSQ
ncbi:MAG: SCO family protein [Cyclobacteriaceae bacterium]|nr:SCO family protein [Cyclobacteriaceae bacterium]MDX5467329.1 SCO family protein [Cyclobacteriaceae bacterium]